MGTARCRQQGTLGRWAGQCVGWGGDLAGLELGGVQYCHRCMASFRSCTWLAAPQRHGMAWQGVAWHGAWQGMACCKLQFCCRAYRRLPTFGSLRARRTRFQ